MKDTITCSLTAIIIIIASLLSYSLLEPGFLQDLALIFLIIGVSGLLWITAWSAVRPRLYPMAILNATPTTSSWS